MEKFPIPIEALALTAVSLGIVYILREAKLDTPQYQPIIQFLGCVSVVIATCTLAVIGTRIRRK